MVTKNYYKLLGAFVTNTDNKISAKNYSGNNVLIYPDNRFVAFGIDGDSAWSASMGYTRTSLSGSGGVLLGDGDTPPTPDDYKLAGNIISGFTYTKVLKKIYNDPSVSAKVRYTITNAKDTEITIKEIGLISGSSRTPNDTSSKILLDRTVLDTPVTIPAGGIGQVEYTITFNYPTAT